jgi:hypothetical protein
MKHFQILATTVLIGGADNPSLDIITQEVYTKYEKSITEFVKNVNDIMVLNSEKNNFETSFFHLRTTIKVRNSCSTQKLLLSLSFSNNIMGS